MFPIGDTNNLGGFAFGWLTAHLFRDGESK
jgi:hypothetical protein